MADSNGANSLTIEPGERSKVVIVKDFDEAAVAREFRDFYANLPPEDDESRVFYFTEPHVGNSDRMGLFGDFAPSVIFAANRFHGLGLPFRERYLREFAGSKLCHLYCTLDKSVMFGFHNRHMARSKVHNLDSVANILRRPDLILDPEPLENKEITPEEVIETLFKVKKNATRLLREIRIDYNSTHPIEPSPHTFQYPGLLERIVGENNLSRILLYGSSAKEPGKDFDNFGVLRTLPEDLYQRIRGTKPSEGGKEVGVIFIPEHVLQEFLYINVSATLFRRNAKSLKGRFDIPIETPRYQIFKEMYHAGFGSAKLLSGMNLVFKEPEIFFDKPGLFEYFMKLNRFTLQGLSQREGYVVLSKEDTLARMKQEFGFEIPEFRQDAEYLQESFVRANRASIDMARKLYDPALAAEPNEIMIRLTEKHTDKIFSASANGQRVYVFGGEEPMHVDQVVPAKMLEESDPAYNSRRRELHFRGIQTSGINKIAKRQ